MDGSKKAINEDEVANFYRSSTAYQQRMARKDGQFWQQVFRHYVGQVLPYCGPAAKVLDLGCGGGWSCLEFSRARSDLSVIGLDLSAAAFRIGAYQASPGIRFVEGNAMQLPFAAEAFDVVTSYAMLEHIPDAEKALDEMVRVLRPNGTLIVCGPNMLSPLRLGRLVYKGIRERRRHPDGKPTVALKMIWALLRKMSSRRSEFIYREPVLYEACFQGSDWDAVYLLNPVDLARFAVARRLEVISVGSAGRWFSRVVAKVVPEFAGGVYFVARKVVH
jgi:ubiquinone/menaquinone biosynthesis C-methylase UbiE